MASPSPSTTTADAGKINDDKTPDSPAQTSFGCTHVRGLLQQARQQAVEKYTKIIATLRRNGTLSHRIHRGAAASNATARVTYLCLQCGNVNLTRERHRKEHGFSVESGHGFVYCHECKDFIYDPTFEEIRSANGKKRKVHTWADDGDKRLVTNNTTATPCSATGLRGLYNMGQTCFMSVILQSLVHNPFIRTYYLSEGHRSVDCDREACTSCALDDIITDFYGQDKHEGYGAVHMLQGCWKGGGGLAGYSQQDAHEYFGFIRDSLHEANTEDDDGRSKDCHCVVHQTFGGTLKSTVTCTTCKNITTNLEPFMDLSLEVRSAGLSVKKKKLAMMNGTSAVKEIPPMDLTECLDRYTSAEVLPSDSYHCRKCNASREAKKKYGLARLPPVIPIHLKRFSHTKSNSQSTKIDTKVRFPFTLDISSYVVSVQTKGKPPARPEPDDDDDDDNSSKDEDTIEVKTPTKVVEEAEAPIPLYELSSVVVHRGKIDNGHYISYSRQGSEWFRFDDSMVVQVDENEVLTAEAYMLFYVVSEF